MEYIKDNALKRTPLLVFGTNSINSKNAPRGNGIGPQHYLNYRDIEDQPFHGKPSFLYL